MSNMWFPCDDDEKPVHAVVQYHPARAPLLPALLEKLPGAVIVEDPKPDEGVSPWRCYRACLRAALEIGGDVVIVQDDAVPCPSFLEVAARASAVHPDDPVAFFTTGRCRTAQRARLARSNGHRFVPVDRLEWIPTVAVAWPQSVTEHVLRWAEGYAPERWDMKTGYRADDGVIGMWMKRNRRQAWVTVPNLVEHPDTVPSVVRVKNRRTDLRVAAVPWSGDPLQIVWG